MKAIHLQVLLAVCGAVNPNTGIAVIRQMRIAEKLNRPRPKITLAVNDLVEWGYFQKIFRGRRKGGRYNTLAYRVIYEQLTHVTHVGDMGEVTPGGNDTPLPRGEQYSDYSHSNPSAPPKRIDDGAAAEDGSTQIVDEFLRLRLLYWPNVSSKPAQRSKLLGQAQDWLKRGSPTALAIEIMDRVMQRYVTEGQRCAPNNLGFCDMSMDSHIAQYKNAVQRLSGDQVMGLDRRKAGK